MSPESKPRTMIELDDLRIDPMGKFEKLWYRIRGMFRKTTPVMLDIVDPEQWLLECIRLDLTPNELLNVVLDRAIKLDLLKTHRLDSDD